MELGVIIGVIVVVLVVQAIVKAAAASSGPSYANLVQRGVPARGILLSVSSTPSGSVGISPWKCQMRAVVMDIEIPGQPPFQATVMPFIPTNLVRDVLPGATVELRINPKKPQQVAIVGPGVGFNAALLNSTTSQGN